MRISGGLKEDGVVIGNIYDKYGSTNPIVRRFMKGFKSSLEELVSLVNPKTIHEVGCGEGYWTLRWLEQGIAARGSDFSSAVIDMAQTNAVERNMSPDLFKVSSIYDLDPEHDAAELVVCLEVLEHLENPDMGLRALHSISSPYLIVSVPREPLWSIMNMIRGKYLSHLGNTPGHIQKWSQRDFLRFVSGYYVVEEVRAPIPWTMLLSRRCDGY